MVGVAQLVRAPDCGSGGRRFESDHPPHTFFISILGCRQAVRHSTLTAAFVGSNPATPAKNPHSQEWGFYFFTLHFSLFSTLLYRGFLEVISNSE